MADHECVTNAAWLRTAEAVDDTDQLDDQFQPRPVPGAEAYWTRTSGTPWPRSSRGWRSMGRPHGASDALRAGR